MHTSLARAVAASGMSDKAARAYLACLELGEATVQQIAERAKLKRTSVYYVIDELVDAGALLKTKRNKKLYYIPEAPAELLKQLRERVRMFEEAVPLLESAKHSAIERPRVYFLYGVPGFKQIWEKIFAQPDREYRIITEGASFLNFVREKYIVDEIIRKKVQLHIRSRQLITDSTYARKIVAKDARENRQSKFLPPNYPLPFTEIICTQFVAFISPRYENMLLVIESESFAKTHESLFNSLWDHIEKS